MTSINWHLAQVNIARAKDVMTSPVMADFVAALDGINALAESSPGFVWRLKDDSGNATQIQAFDDPLMIVNLSVWESIDSLHAFTYRSDHARIFARRREWFDALGTPHMALWWIAAGTLPDVHEAKRRLSLLRELGPTPQAFTFKQRYTAEALEQAAQ